MAAPQQSGQDDQSMAILWLVAAAFATVGAIWYFFKVQIIGVYLDLKLLELNFFSFFTNNLEPTKELINYYKADPNQASFQQVLAVGKSVGSYLRIPFVIILLILAFVVYYGNLVRTYKRIYTMRDLVTLEKTNWPQTTPVAGLDLIHTDIDVGPWAMALTPMQYCKRYKLLEEYRPQRQEGMSKQEWSRVEVHLRRGEANKLFALQLGPAWEGVDKLTPQAKSLFAIFVARFNADTKAAQECLTKLNISSDTKLDFQCTDELLKKHRDSQIVKDIGQAHAYVFTVMASMLEAARQDGVQASADFLWLKPLDRRLWYILNTVGRQTPFVEVAGIFAHWTAEKEAGKSLLVPMVEEATRALDVALKEVIYKPEKA